MASSPECNPIPHLIKINNELLKLNQECLILTEAGNCQNPTTGCHVISKGYLERLTRIGIQNGQVYTWPALPHSIGVIFRQKNYPKIKGKQTVRPLIEDYPPVKVGINEDRVKYAFACQSHDGDIFKLIDLHRSINPKDQETQFKLGFRTTLATTALVKSYHQYMKEGINSDQNIITKLNKVPRMKALFRVQQREATLNLQELSNLLFQELTRWNKIHLDKEWHKAETRVVSAHSRFRVAGTGLYPDTKDGFFTVTVLPQPEDPEHCWIFTTTLPSNILDEALRNDAKKLVKNLAYEIKTSMETDDPKNWIGHLAKNSPFFYIAMDDWDENLDHEQQSFIKTQAAQNMPVMQMNRA